MVVSLPLEDFSKTLDDANEVIAEEKQSGQISGGRVLGSLIKLEMPDRLVVIGDIHGDFATLSTILSEIDHEEYLSDSENKLVFLGDYVDRGTRSSEVLYEVCLLKSRFPDSVVLMRGNHEAHAEFPFPSHDFPTKLVGLYGLTQAKTLYGQKILSLFDGLYLSIMIDNIFLLVHGGVPTCLPQNHLDAVETLSHAQDNYMVKETMEEILWNDPRDIIPNNANYEQSRRGIGKHFGQSVSNIWLNKSNTKVIVRGHEPCEGFKINHEGLVFTIFSCKEPYSMPSVAYLDVTSEGMMEMANAYDLQQHLRYI